MTNPTMDLGAFSVSLAVKDLAASRAFYVKLGFEPVLGDGTKWLILRSGTFNPGWDAVCNPLAEFTDVRALQKRVRAAGIEPATPVAESGTGPGSFVVVDPDGNPILFDQHVG
jgi:catechol 2,3-dioxygenase-like lactoylglutathione lyase family enzyme